jgi:hypothetical protein
LREIGFVPSKSANPVARPTVCRPTGQLSRQALRNPGQALPIAYQRLPRNPQPNLFSKRPCNPCSPIIDATFSHCPMSGWRSDLPENAPKIPKMFSHLSRLSVPLHSRPRNRATKLPPCPVTPPAPGPHAHRTGASIIGIRLTP